MREKIKRFLTLVLAVVLTLGVLPVTPAYADGAVRYEAENTYSRETDPMGDGSISIQMEDENGNPQNIVTLFIYFADGPLILVAAAAFAAVYLWKRRGTGSIHGGGNPDKHGSKAKKRK